MPTTTISRCGGTTPATGTFAFLLLETSPDALWRLNETAGTTVADSLAGHHTMQTSVTTPTLAADTAPTGDLCPYFPTHTGWNSGGVGYAPNLSGDFTVALWMRRLSSVYQAVMGQGAPEITRDGWGISFLQASNVPPDRITLEVGNGVGVPWVTSDAAAIIAQWYWVVATHASGVWNLYVNGVQQASSYSGVYSPTTARIWIGYDGVNFGQSGDFEQSWVTLWTTRAISPTEVATIWAGV